MKFLLVLMVLLVAIWVWRNNRSADGGTARPPAPPKPARPTDMVACLQCGTHVPEGESVAGRDGPYCCQEHRRQREERT